MDEIGTIWTNDSRVCHAGYIYIYITNVLLYRHGLPEDMHYALLADFSMLRSALSQPLLMEVRSVIQTINKFVKSNGGQKKGAAFKKDTRLAGGKGSGDIFDLLDKCPFVFEFPRITEREILPSLPSPISTGEAETMDSSWMLVDEMKLSGDMVF